MAKRPAYTLLFIKSDLIARADFGAAPNLTQLGFSEQPRGGDARLQNSVGEALKSGGKCGRSVWVIGEEFWTQTLSLPANALRGLSHEQIAKAISFDVEALTGLGGADSAIGFCKAAPADATEHLWVTQAPVAARTQIQAAIKKAGGVLAGILHPGGLPAPMDAEFDSLPGASWRRIEVWRDATFCMTGSGLLANRLDIVNGDREQETWRVGVQRWLNANQAAHSEWLGRQGPMGSELAYESSDSWTALPSLTGSGLQEWLGRWMSKLADGVGASVPLIEAHVPSTVQRKRILVAAAVAVACLIGCFARGAWLDSQRTKLAGRRVALTNQVNEKTKRLADLDAPKKQWDELQEKIRVLRADLQTRRNDRLHAPPHAVPDFELQRHRVDELLKRLAGNANPGLLVDHISPQGNGDLLVEGKCLPNTSADTFADQLGQALPKVGWEASPAQKTPTGFIPSGQFSVRISPTPQKTTTAAPEEIIPSSASAGGIK